MRYHYTTSRFIIPNKHLLDFTRDTVITIPEWFDPEIKGLHSGGPDTGELLTYIERAFNNYYNVYYCYPEIYGENGNRNINEFINHVNTHYNHQILVCVIDIENEDQKRRFKEVFNNYFNRIEIGIHSHQLSITDAEEILDSEGIYYRNRVAESIFSLHNLRTMLSQDLSSRRRILETMNPTGTYILFNIYRNIRELHTADPNLLQDLKIIIVNKIFELIDTYSFIKFKVLGIFTLLDDTTNILCAYYVYIFLLESFVLSVPDSIYVYLDITNPNNIMSYFIKQHLPIEDAISDYHLITPTDHNKKYLKYKNKYLKYKNKYLQLKKINNKN